MQVVDVMGTTHKIEVGQEVFIPCKGRGGHGAWAFITKVKRKTFEAEERKGSYIPGTKWSVHMNATFAIVERPQGKAWMKHWIND